MGELHKQLTGVWIFFKQNDYTNNNLGLSLSIFPVFPPFSVLGRPCNCVCGEAAARVSGRAPMQGSIRQKPISHRANFINMEYSPTFSSA